MNAVLTSSAPSLMSAPADRFRDHWRYFLVMSPVLCAQRTFFHRLELSEILCNDRMDSPAGSVLVSVPVMASVSRARSRGENRVERLDICMNVLLVL